MTAIFAAQDLLRDQLSPIMTNKLLGASLNHAASVTLPDIARRRVAARRLSRKNNFAGDASN